MSDPQEKKGGNNYASLDDMRRASVLEGMRNDIPGGDDNDDDDNDDNLTSSFAEGLTTDLCELKDKLVSRVSVSLLQGKDFTTNLTSDLKDSPDYDNARRIASLVHAVSLQDGEFVLKLALYVRRELYIRHTAALLVALCAFEPNCRPFLKCYMRHIICLPSDWLTIANIAMTRPHMALAPARGDASGDPSETAAPAVDGGEERGERSLPSALRRALVATFSMFDDFALSKYNTERHAKKLYRREKHVERSDSEESAPKPVRQLTMKDYIRRLHISKPAYAVSCLLGKRYPDTEEEFRVRGLDEDGKRTFDPELRGKRMRLPTAKMWEMRLSSCGNKGEVWDDLIAKNQVPFMATLRNLRHLIFRGCSEDTHAAVIRRLTSEEQVVASLQFPFRFFSAYKAVEFAKVQEPNDAGRRRGRAKAPVIYDMGKVQELQKRYRDALERAAEISMRLNISPICGMSLVIICAEEEFLVPCKQSKPKIEEAALLALALKYACEHCVLLLVLKDTWRVMDWDFHHAGGMLQNVELIKKICEEAWSPGEQNNASNNGTQSVVFPYAYLDDMIERRVNIQSVIVMGQEHSCYSGRNDAPSLGDLPVYIKRMRRACNKDLLFISLSSSMQTPPVVGSRYSQKNDILLFGFSDAVLRFVTQHSMGKAWRHVERLDEVYGIDRAGIRPGPMPEGELRALKQMILLEKDHPGLKDGLRAEASPRGSLNGTQTSLLSGTATTTLRSQEQASPERGLLSTYRECRFFISSTFIDMNSERNALVLEVFPRLRRWASEMGLHVNIVEVDLRWGITEDASSSNLSLSVCLNEVSRCSPFFLGVIGSRYGYCPPTLYHRVDDDVDAEDFAWLRQLPNENPTRMSVTEMEMRHAVFTAARRTGRPVPQTMAFFVRDHSALMKSLQLEDRDAYAPDTPTTMQSLSKLSGYLTSQGAPMISYNATGMRPSSNALSGISLISNKKSALQVPLDVSDFSRKAFVALKSIVLQYCGRHDDANEPVRNPKGGDHERQKQRPSRDTTAKKPDMGGTLYEKEYMDHVSFTKNLLKTFVPPRGLLEKLSLFVLTGRVSSDAVAAEAVSVEDGANAPLAADSDTASIPASFDTPNRFKSSNVLLLHGYEGNGLSSVSAAVASHFVQLPNSSVLVVHFACQASNVSLRLLVYYLIFSLVSRLQLQEDFCVRESDSVATLLQLLPHVYAAAARRRYLCIVLDGLEKAPCAAEILNNLGWIVPSNAAPGLRFIITATPTSQFAAALRLRVPPALSVTLPELNMPERAELIRRHLAFYGKRLQESFRVNELKVLLRKQGSNQASYLTFAITYLRLFSSFDTLRADIATLPSTLPQLHAQTHKQLEERFDVRTCRAVLVSLYVSQKLSGLKEYNLYRLVSNVASATRLVALLSGTCLRVTRKSVMISNASFEASIAARYLPSSLDVIDACASMLEAELYFRPLATDMTRHEIRDSIRAAMNSIRRGPVETCVFRPERHTPSQLLALLQFALRAKEYDMLVTLASYVPFIKHLLVNATYLQRFINVLLQASAVNSLLSRQLHPIIDFMQKECHVIMNHPNLLWQYILNLPSRHKFFHGLDHNRSGLHADDMSSSTLSGGGAPATWIRWMNPSQHGEEGRTLAFPMTQPLLCVALSDDGKFMAVGGNDLMVRVVPLGALDRISASLRHAAPVTAIAFFPTRPNVLLTGCKNGVLRVWSLEDNSLLQQGAMKDTRRISSLACHPTNSVVCTGSHDGRCAVWHIVSNVSEYSLQSFLKPSQVLKHHRAPVSCVAYHRLGDVLATGSWEGRVYFINMERPMEGEMKAGASLKYEHQVLETQGPVRALAFMPSMVVTCAVALYSGDLCLYDYASALCTARLTIHAGIPITSIAFSPDAKLMALANEKGNVRIMYAGVTGTVIATLNSHRQPVTSVAFHQLKPSTLFTSSVDRSLKEWSLRQTNQTNRTEMRGAHPVIVTACAAASDGSFFVTGDMDGMALVFAGRDAVGGGAFCNADDKDDFFAPYFVLRHEPHRVSCICIAMQNTRILCGTAAGEVFIWAASPGLNHREGRLLQRIRVVKKNAYPVIFIECNNTDMTGVNGDGPRLGIWGAAASRRSSGTRATALTTNGAMAAWEMYDDDGATMTLKEEWVEETLSSVSSAVTSDNDEDAQSDPSRSSDAGSEDESDANSTADEDKNSSERQASSCRGREASDVPNSHGNCEGRSETVPSLEKSHSHCGTAENTAQVALQRSSLRWVIRDRHASRSGSLLLVEQAPVNAGSYSRFIPYTVAEEIVAAVSLVRNRQSDRWKTTARGGAVMGEHGAAPGVHHDAGLLSGRFIAVGRCCCHLLVPSLQRAIVVPVRNPMRLEPEQIVGVGNVKERGVYRILKKEDFFACASNCVRVERTSIGEEGDGIFTGMLFAVGTNRGLVLILEGAYEAPYTDHDTTSMRRKRLMMRERKRTRVTLRCVKRITRSNSDPIPVDSIALTTLNEATEEQVVRRDVLTTLRVLVGCRDGSTRLFTVFPFRDGADSSVDGDNESSRSANSKAERRMREEEEEVDENDRELVDAWCSGAWKKEGMFFASSGVTALTFLRVAGNVPSSRLGVGMAGGNWDTSLPSVVARPAAATSRLFYHDSYIAGDWLGNVYQLRVESDGGNKKNKLGNIESPTSSSWATEMRWMDGLRQPAATGAGQQDWGWKAPALFPSDHERRDGAASAVNARRVANWRREERRITSMFVPPAEDPRAAGANAAAMPAAKKPEPVPPHPNLCSAPAAVAAATPASAEVTAGVPPYELILEKMPAGLDPSQRTEWLQRRQRLLVEAMQAQRNAVKARAVLAEYSKDALLSLGILPTM